MIPRPSKYTSYKFPALLRDWSRPRDLEDYRLDWEREKKEYARIMVEIRRFLAIRNIALQETESTMWFHRPGYRWLDDLDSYVTMRKFMDSGTVTLSR